MDPYTITAAPPVLTLAGEFDLGAREELTDAMLAVVRDPRAGAVILDVAPATFIDSEALSAIIVGMNAARDAGKPFRIRGAAGVVHRVLDVAGVLELTRDDHV